MRWRKLFQRDIGSNKSTRTHTPINGVEVKSYNIGGKTAVIIEDILKEDSHQYIYDESSRTLKFLSLNPKFLIKEKHDNKTTSGKIIGDIYETDIKATIYDITIPTYNIKGKTAVVIEDLGCDGGFSAIGGKYIWDADARTISLEFLYQSPKYHSDDKNIILTANNDMSEMNATFENTIHCEGNRETIIVPDNTDNILILPIKANNAIIGYYFSSNSSAFTYYYPANVKMAEKATTPTLLTRERIISHFLNHHSVGDALERFDTDNYSFVYISVAGTSWTAYNILQIYDDGTYIDYGEKIKTTNRSPQNLTIDKENEKVTFKYVDRYTSEWFTNYEIDLKTAKISTYNTLTTDIGTGRPDGQPPEPDQTESRNGQHEYILVSGEDKKTVNGFFTREYYYADMLPLSETFDFLNIKYSFENDILYIDTSEARAFNYQLTETTTDVLGESQIEYLYVDKVMLNGNKTEITYSFISGHFDNASQGRAQAKPYVCNSKVYINSSFISWLY